MENTDGLLTMTEVAERLGITRQGAFRILERSVAWRAALVRIGPKDRPKLLQLPASLIETYEQERGLRAARLSGEEENSE